MRSFVKIAGIDFAFDGLAIREQIIFPGCGKVYGAAIERTSKNRYKLHVITKVFAYVLDYTSIEQACEKLQDVYNRYGTFLPDVGEKLDD